MLGIAAWNCARRAALPIRDMSRNPDLIPAARAGETPRVPTLELDKVGRNGDGLGVDGVGLDFLLLSEFPIILSIENPFLELVLGGDSGLLGGEGPVDDELGENGLRGPRSEFSRMELAMLNGMEGREGRQ